MIETEGETKCTWVTEFRWERQEVTKERGREREREGERGRGREREREREREGEKNGPENRSQEEKQSGRGISLSCLHCMSLVAAATG